MKKASETKPPPATPKRGAAKPKRAAPTEAEHYAASLAAHGRIGTEEPLAPGQTHLAEPEPSGKVVLRRKRFSAF